MEKTEIPPPTNFSGTWLTTTGETLILVQKEYNVTGTFIGPGHTALIDGMVQENQLTFSCYNILTIDKELTGKGILITVPGTCTGTWEYSPYGTNNKPISAEALEPIPPEQTLENLPATDKMSLKHAGYDLIHQHAYAQAIPLLEQALQLYRDALHQQSFGKDSYQIDEISIQASLLECYFNLADPHMQQDTYTSLLDLLLASVNSYQNFLQNTFQRHTRALLEEIASATTFLQPPQQQLHALIAQVAPDELVQPIRSLDTLLQEITAYLLNINAEITIRGEQTFGQTETLVQNLAALNNLCSDIQHQTETYIQCIIDSSKQWPLEQVEAVQSLSFPLQSISLAIEGKQRLIAHMQQNAQERIDFTWESAFRLSNWLERWRVRLPSDVEKISTLEKGQPFFQKLITFYIDVNNGPEALVLSERARTRAFADLLAARSSPAHPLLEHNRATGSKPPSSREDILKIVQARKSVTIEYFLTTERLLIWIITPSGTIETISVVISNEHLDTLVNTLVSLLETPAHSSAERSRSIVLLRELYTYLIAPIPHDLLHTEKDDVLTIIPHSPLFRVPFAALQNGQGTYFIEEHALVYAPSIDILKYMQNTSQHPRDTDQPSLLAFVSPQQAPDSGLSPLQFSAEHFERIAAFYHNSKYNKIYKGMDATRHHLEQEAANHAVLCFITHAQALDNDPLNSYLVLAGQSFADGQFKVPDIARLKLAADLVIVAACETGRGHITGDGVNGLSRAFISAGTSSLLLSLWSISEQETMQQLYRFHHAWRTSGISKALALQRVQIERIRNYQREQPDVWAGLILMGEAV